MFSTVVELMTLAVLGLRPSLQAAARRSENPPVSLAALYDKVNRTEPEVLRALVQTSAARLAPAMAGLSPNAILPGWQMRVLDGNHFPGTVPRPVIVGQQIALIAGPAGEKIYTEQFGRVKLCFPWDRWAKGDGSDTCWVRVGQPWAGTSWGYQVIPRVGMEALISYQEGDPDRPFVMALVPDPKNPVPYKLPGNKTRMVVRSNSYKSTGYNEMTFEDATGAENVFFHAQKDHTTRIENNRTDSIGSNHAQGNYPRGAQLG